jgi:hypothetical protein
MQQFYKFITWRFVSLNIFRAPPHPPSAAYNCINSLWFYRWSVVVAALLVVVWPYLYFWFQNLIYLLLFKNSVYSFLYNLMTYLAVKIQRRIAYLNMEIITLYLVT